MLRLLFLIWCVFSFLNPVYGAVDLKDEGTSQGFVWSLDCVGAGISCSESSAEGTLNISTGGTGNDSYIEEGGAAKVDTTGANMTLNFGAGFDIALPGGNQADVTIDLTEDQVDLTTEVTGVLPDANVANDITLTNITQITTRAAESLTSSCTDGEVLGGTAGGGVECQADAGGAEVNNLETITTGIATTEIPIGTAANTVVYAALSGDAIMTNGGVVTVADDSHNHVITNIDAFSEANLETQLSDVTALFTNNVTGDVTVSGGTSAITAGVIIETDISGDVDPIDGDFLQYDSTGTNFTWRSGSETLSDIGAEGDLADEAGLYAALSDVADFVQGGEANSIDSDMYVDGSIDLAHMSSASVDSDNIVDNTIANADMADNSIDSDDYVDGSIDDAHIADDTIQEPALNTTNAAGAGTDNYMLTYNHAGTNFTWVAASGSGDFLADGTVPMTGDINLDGNNIDNGGVIFLKEQAEADADVAGSGQIWVNTATPNELWWTDDAGTDTQLGVGGGGATAFDDIGDPDADGTIAFAGYEQLITSTLDEADHVVLKIDDTDADLANEVTLFVLEYTDDGDEDGIFARFNDNNGDTKFEVASEGTTTIGDGTTGYIDTGVNTFSDTLNGNIQKGYKDLWVQSAKITGDHITTGASIDAGHGPWRLQFAGDGTEEAVWQFRMPYDFDNGLVAKIGYVMEDATSGSETIDFEVKVMAVGDGESEDIDSNGFDSLNEVTGGTTVPATADYLDEISLSLANDDSIEAGQLAIVHVQRDHDDGDDDPSASTDHAEIVYLQLEYNRK